MPTQALTVVFARASASCVRASRRALSSFENSFEMVFEMVVASCAGQVGVYSSKGVYLQGW